MSISDNKHKTLGEHLDAYEASIANGTATKDNRMLRRLRLYLARESGTHTKEQWKSLCEEFGYRCVRCGCDWMPLERDHIIPIYQRGSDSILNIQPLCKKCNGAKGSENFNWSVYRRKNGFSVEVARA